MSKVTLIGIERFVGEQHAAPSAGRLMLAVYYEDAMLTAARGGAVNHLGFRGRHDWLTIMLITGM